MSKVLIIEDNESYATILTQKLIHEQFEVLSASEGDEGLKKALFENPDILLIDLLLPKMNGVKVMEEIRKTEKGKNLPFLILTNLNPDSELEQNIQKNHPAYYLVKPQITLDEIIQKIRRILNISLEH